jgi:hypothetical protein
MNQPQSKNVSRRRFLSSAAAGAATAIVAPAVLKPRNAKAAAPTIVGKGDHRYEAIHGWPQLPSQFTWQTTHNVAIDRDCNLYVIHEGRAEQKDHPAIFVFDPEGKYIRSFGSQFQGGGHGLEVRDEGGEQFLYVTGYQQLKTFAKLTLEGETVWQKFAPMKSGVYAEGEDTMPQKVWGRDRFMPTNFAFLDDGGFLLADGYGSFFIHRYDKNGEWQSKFGGAGEGMGTFNTPHGLWIDRRPGREPAVVVTDRANHTLQYFTLDGKYLETISGFGLPANADTWNDLLVVPELYGRVSLLDAKNQVAAYLGDDAERIRNDSKFAIRGDESQWNPGRFVHPHDACFDAEGNIYVAEWVATGRITKLKRLA